MKKLFGTLLFTLAFALCLPAFALADMASLPSLALASAHYQPGDLRRVRTHQGHAQAARGRKGREHGRK